MMRIRVVSYHGNPLPTEIAHTFTSAGGSIGRADTCELRLADAEKYVSRVHAKIVYDVDGFYIEDVGRNPSIINTKPLGGARRKQLVPGDSLVIGDYQLSVEGNASLVPASGSVVLRDDFDVFAAPKSSSDVSSHVQANNGPVAEPLFVADELSSVSLVGVGLAQPNPAAFFDAVDRGASQISLLPDPLTGESPKLAASEYRGSFGNQISPESLPFKSTTTNARMVANTGNAEQHAPALSQGTRPPIGLLPDDWDIESDDDFSQGFANPNLGHLTEPPQVAPEEIPHEAVAVRDLSASNFPQSQFATHHQHSNDAAILGDLLRELGIRYQDIEGQDARQVAVRLASLFRASAEGLVGLLQARAMTKREIRSEMTLVGSSSNNPLKILPDAQAAIAHLFAPATVPGYLPPLEAITRAFDDVRSHELAMLAGMKAALISTVAQLDPKLLETRVGELGGLSTLLQTSRKAKLWDAMVEEYQRRVQEINEDFERSLGAAFSKAYDDQARLIRTKSEKSKVR
jgi:type VI secretion system protein